MPRDTFFNLPKKKQKRIIDAALDEFSEKNYHKAKISEIVNKAGIAKGSFYQYFKNKKEMFKYIINIIGEQKMKYLENLIKNQSEMNFFDFLEKLYKRGLQFAIDYPRLNKIGNKFFSNSNSELFTEIMEENKNKNINFFENLIQQGIKKNQIDDKVDLKLTALLLTNINIFIGELVYKKDDIEMEDMEIVKNILYIIENGLKKD